MRNLVWAALLALAGCGGASVVARGPDGITVRPLDGDEQAAENLAVEHCGRSGRLARLVGEVGFNGRRYECTLR